MPMTYIGKGRVRGWGRLLPVLLCLVGFAVVLWERWSIAAALVLVIFTWGTITFALRFLEAVEQENSLWWESHWGGLGGGVWGFRIPRSWLFLLAAVAFGLMLAVVASRSGNRTATMDNTSQGGGQPRATATPATNPGASPGLTDASAATETAGSSLEPDSTGGNDAGAAGKPPSAGSIGADPGHDQPPPIDEGAAFAPIEP